MMVTRLEHTTIPDALEEARELLENDCTVTINVMKPETGQPYYIVTSAMPKFIKANREK